MTATRLDSTPENTAGAKARSSAAEGSAEGAFPRLRRWLRQHRADLIAHAIFLAAAVFLFGHLWLDVRHRVLGSNPADQSFAEWMYADQARTLSHFGNPFFSHGQNAPLGINLMGNVATQLVSWIMAPVTLLFGSSVTFAAVATLNLAGTASAWYHVLSRHLVRHRLAAFAGAAFCGFSPGMVSESNAHVHIPAQFLVPFLLWAMLRLREPGRAVRGGIVLGLLVAAQLLIGEEVLFLTAIACTFVVGGYTALRRQAVRVAVRPFLTGLLVAGAVVVLVCGYPLWMQFFGPRHYRGLVATYSADLSTYVTFPTQSIGGLTGGPAYAPDLAEQAAFFGWPLTLGAIGLAALLWRSLAARLVAITGAGTAALSLGPHIFWKGRDTGVPGPYWLLLRLPVFDSLITLRLALVTAAAIGVLLAFGTDWVVDRAAVAREAHIPLRALAVVMAVAVLAPLLPRPLPAIARLHVPLFVTSGHWQRYVRDSRTLVPVDSGYFGNLRWGSAGEAHFAVPQGFTLVPRNPPHDLTGVFNVPHRPTETLLESIAGGRHAAIGSAERRQAVEDLRWLHADAVVMEASPAHTAAMADDISALLGRGAELVDDVYVWQVRDL